MTGPRYTITAQHRVTGLPPRGRWCVTQDGKLAWWDEGQGWEEDGDYDVTIEPIS